MRRTLLICAGLLGSAAIAAPVASAAPASIIGTGGDVFAPTTYAHDAGTVASFTSTGGTHNVTAFAGGPDGQALFRSETISSGSTPVNGTQYIGAGGHAFLCTIHPSTMQGTLNVSGTPLARPELKAKVKSKSLDQAVGQSAVKVKVTITGGSGERAEVDLKLGKKKIGGAATRKTKTVKVKLTKKGRRLLAKKNKAKVKAEASIDFGSPAKASRVLK